MAVLSLFRCACGYLPRVSVLWRWPWLPVTGAIRVCGRFSAEGGARVQTLGYLPIERLLEINL